MTSASSDMRAEASVLDRLAIEDTLHRHCRGLDRCDAELLTSCYWPEAEVDYGSYKGRAHDFAGLVVSALGDSYELTRHRISNILISFKGVTARVESYVCAVHLLPGGEQEMRFEGRYLDTLEKRDERWAMCYRQVVMDWSDTCSVTDGRYSEAFSALARGHNDKRDPVYPHLSGE